MKKLLTMAASAALCACNSLIIEGPTTLDHGYDEFLGYYYQTFASCQSGRYVEDAGAGGYNLYAYTSASCSADDAALDYLYSFRVEAVSAPLGDGTGVAYRVYDLAGVEPSDLVVILEGAYLLNGEKYEAL